VRQRAACQHAHIDKVHISTCCHHSCQHVSSLQAEVWQENDAVSRLRKAGKLTGILAQELSSAVGLTQFGIRAVRSEGEDTSIHVPLLVVPIRTAIYA